MKKIIRISQDVLLLLRTIPVQLPAKVKQVLQYIGLALGILEKVVITEESNQDNHLKD